jgi:Tfp pilus assembly protein PilN
VSILINLLPDMRQAKLRERRRRQLVAGVSVMIWAVCGAIIVFMSLYVAAQKVIINNATNSINSEKKQLSDVPNIIDAYTAEQHLASLPGLYSQRVYMTKFFDAYTQANPQDVTLNSMNVDQSNLLTVNGSGKSYAAVAKLARALEAANVKVGNGAQASNTPYFTNVHIMNVQNSGAGTNSKSGVQFSIEATLQSGVTSGSQQQ